MKPQAILVTNGGPHPADKWADVTASAIADLVQVKDDAVSPEATAARAAKRDLMPKLFAIFNEHHATVQGAEQALKAGVTTVEQAADHVAQALDPMPYVEPTMAKVHALLATTPFAAHFAKDEVKTVLANIVGQHTADVMNIERLWHRDAVNATAKGA